MTIELPPELEAALKIQANAHGITVSGYLREVVERDLASLQQQGSKAPFKTGRGTLAHLGQAPSAEEIDRNRSEMFGAFGDRF